MKKDHSLWVEYFFIAVILLIFALFFYHTISPLYPGLYGWDSAFFRFIGKEILKGKTPYTDIWDNKGPVLFFIQAIGALNGTDNRKISLIFPMALLSLIISVIFLERADTIIHHSGNRQRLQFVLKLLWGLIPLCAVAEGGNLSEDWSLPMITCSLYLFTKYAMEAERKTNDDRNHPGRRFSHPRKYAFFHGICFSLISMIRVNNAVSICAGLLVIGIVLIAHRQWKNLFENILFGLLGIAAATVPVGLWYLSRHALREMFYAVFVFNLKYAAAVSGVRYSGRDFLIRYLPAAISVLLIMLSAIRIRKIRLIDYIAMAIVSANLIILALNNIYSHYFVIFFPVFLFTLVLYAKIFRLSEILPLVVMISVFIPVILPGLFYQIRQRNHRMFPSESMFIPKSERNSMIAIDVPAEIYLIPGMEPCSRFAAYQTVHFPINPAFQEEFIRTLEEKDPKWIIRPCWQTLPYPEIENFILSNYEVRFEEGISYCFLRRIENDPN